MRQLKRLTAALLNATSNLAGNEAPTVVRGRNIVLRGGMDGDPYFACFEGNLDLGENYNLNTADFKITGTITYTEGATNVIGAGTLFKSELHPAQLIMSAAGEPLEVKEIISDLLFICDRPATTTAAAQFAMRLPQMTEMNSNKRLVMLTGSGVQFEKGHIIAVGSGKVYVNGVAIPGFVATSRPQVAIYRPTTDDYDIRDMGFDDAPPQPTIDVVAGGTKGMVDGNKHSFMVAYWTGTPEGTDGNSNPCEVIKAKSGGGDIAIAGANNRFEFDFTTSLVGAPANAKGFVIYGSLGGKAAVTDSGGTSSTTSPNQTNFDNGPWYEVAKVLTTDLTAGDKYLLEYLDSEVYELVTGNNDRPPHCEYVSKLEGKPIYISAFGKATTGKPEGGNPGPSCVIGKFANPDAAPTEWLSSIKNDIIGFFEGVGRIFLITRSSLDFVAPTGLLGQSFQGTLNLELPILTRPYWQTGAANRYAITMMDDTIVGFSGRKPVQSIGNGDENVKKYEFGGVIEDITRFWYPGHVYTGRDPKNTQALFIYTAAFKNDAGYWCSVIQPFSVFRKAWLPEIVLSSDTQDMIVSGIATVDERFEFLAGGRVAGGTYQTRTYRFDERDPNQVADANFMPHYIAWQPSDDGEEGMAKQVHSVRPFGRFSQGLNVQVHGARPGGEFSIDDLEDGVNSLSGNIAFAASSEVTEYLKKKYTVKNLGTYSIRAGGVWDGVGEPDRLEELIIEVSAHGKQR